jgi:hypothetical protein
VSVIAFLWKIWYNLTQRGDYMSNPIIGLKIGTFTSMAEVIKTIRKYRSDSMSAIKDDIQNNRYILTCDYYDSNGIKSIISAYIELSSQNTDVTIYEHDRTSNIQFLENRIQTYKEVSEEADAESELEQTDLSIIEPYSYLWTTEQADWGVIIENSSYAIVNIKTHKILSIDDEELNNKVAAMMIMMGNTRFDNINQAFDA